MALRHWSSSITRGLHKHFILQRSKRRFILLTQPRYMSDMSGQFNQAKENVGKLTQDPGNEVKLKMYALFKQGSVGPCNAPKPGALDFVGKAKWNAWNDLGKITQEDAQKQYIALVESLIAQEPSSDKAEQESSLEPGDFEHIMVTLDAGLKTVPLNRPTKYNALNHKGFTRLFICREVLQKVKSGLDEVYYNTEKCEEKIDSLKRSASCTSPDRESPEVLSCVKQLIEGQKVKVEYIRKTINEFENEAESVTESISTELAEAKSKNEQLETRIKDLETKLEKVEKELGEMKDELALGQVAWIFEQEVAKCVIPLSEHEKIKPLGAYTHMQSWLKRNKKNKKGVEAMKKWNDLMKVGHWKEPDHIEEHIEQALSLFKEMRLPYAHPDSVDLEEAKNEILKSVSDEEQQKCLGVILMIEKTRA